MYLLAMLLVTAIPYYHHSVREYIIIYAIMTFGTKTDLTRNAVSLYDKGLSVE